MKIAPGVLAALAVIGALLLVRECSYRDGAKDAEARAADRRTDTTLARMARESFEQEARFARGADSLRGVIQRLRGRVIPRDTIVLQLRGSLADSITVRAQLALRDSLIQELVYRHVQDSLQILFWRAQAVAYRDSLAPALQRARDAWRSASRKRFGCVAGASVTAGLDGRVSYGAGLTCGVKL